MTSAACIAAALTAGIVLAACSDDARMPGAGDDTTAPVTFNFIAVPPSTMTDAATRAVPGHDVWKGDGTEKIVVTFLKEDGDRLKAVSYGTYTITSPEGHTEVLPGDQPAFLPDKQGKYRVTAWYPAKELYDMTNQSTPDKFREADRLCLNTSMIDVTPGNIARLEFQHAMAKVRVELTGADPSAEDIKVSILGRSWFLFSPDMLQLTIGPEAYNAACRDNDSTTPGVVAFEAIIDPNITPKQDFIRITIGSKMYYFTPGGSPDTFKMGHVYTYHVTI